MKFVFVTSFPSVTWCSEAQQSIKSTKMFSHEFSDAVHIKNFSLTLTLTVVFTSDYSSEQCYITVLNSRWDLRVLGWQRYLRLGQFSLQLVNEPQHSLLLLLSLFSIFLKLFVFPSQLSHSFLQLLFVALQQLEEFVCTFHGLCGNTQNVNNRGWTMHMGILREGRWSEENHVQPGPKDRHQDKRGDRELNEEEPNGNKVLD